MSRSLADLRQTLVPRADHPDGPLPPLLLALTVVTGLVDAFSYLILGHVFVANMTGNVVFLRFALAGADGFSISASLIALGTFGLGAVMGGRSATHVGAHRGRLLAIATALEAFLVAASAIAAVTVGSPVPTTARYGLIVLLGLAMGIQNAVARKLAVPDLTTTVLTLTITGIFADGRLAGGASSKVGRRILSPIAMFVGGLGGALLVLRASDPLAIAVAVVILCLVAATAAMMSRAGRDWIHPRPAG